MSSDIQPLMLERMRLIDMAHAWASWTLQGTVRYLRLVALMLHFLIFRCIYFISECAYVSWRRNSSCCAVFRFVMFALGAVVLCFFINDNSFASFVAWLLCQVSSRCCVCFLYFICYAA
jgi:hypothetical protein